MCYNMWHCSGVCSVAKSTVGKSFKDSQLCHAQVSKVVLKSGKELPCDMVIAGVGAKPTGEMYKGQLDFIEERPGGIKVCRDRLQQHRTAVNY